MTAAHTLRTKTYVLIALMVCFGSTGDVLLGKGMKQVGALRDWSPAGLLRFFDQAISTPAVWLGIISLLLFFLSYMLVLSWADFSYVLPASAAGYAVVPLLGHLFLGEAVSPLRWTGVAFICLGVALVGSTPASTTVRTPVPALPAEHASAVEAD
jgi:drug/metabolite transporter (DMT)-like permease